MSKRRGANPGFQPMRKRERRTGKGAWRGCNSKTRFKSEGDAMRSTNRKATRVTGHTSYTRVYDCPRCGGWHVTGREHFD